MVSETEEQSKEARKNRKEKIKKTNMEEEVEENYGEELGNLGVFGDAEELEEDEKRGINYEIAKNKGLTPHRKKEQRNPRVKHRGKYRKALIRKRGQMPDIRKELTRYAGESRGIKIGVVKSVKLA